MPLCKEGWRPMIGSWCEELEKKVLEVPQIGWH
jgi:hypothetical protein